MALRLDTPCYLIPGSRPEGTFGAILEILLKSRLKLRMDEGREPDEEDVNAYLGGLLVSYIDPQYLLAVAPVLGKREIDVDQAVMEAQGHVEAYRIFKVNADDLLISLGIFSRLWQEEKGSLGRLKQYYGSASECQKRIYGKATAVGLIQSKLSGEPERYLTLLSEARSEYLHFVEKVGLEELADFARQLEWERLPLQAKQDALLDSYSAWMNNPDNLELRQKVLRLVEKLKDFDPGFQPASILYRLNAA